MKKIKIDIRDRARAALCYADSQNFQEDATIEAFMGVFHPEKQKDRNYMNKLKDGMNKRGRR